MRPPIGVESWHVAGKQVLVVESIDLARLLVQLGAVVAVAFAWIKLRR